MTVLKSHDTILEKATSGKTRRLAVAAAEDKAVLSAVKTAAEKSVVIPLFVGNSERIKEIAENIGFDISGFEIIHENNPAVSSKKAVQLIREKKADFLMKGMVGTADLMKAVLDKENGLRKGSTLSHIAFFETPAYHKLLALTDAALNVAPDVSEKAAIIRNAVDAYHRLGIEKPKVAVAAAVEKVNPKMEATVDAAVLKTMNSRNQIKGCIVDGPLAVDNIVSKEACEHKGIETEVGGDADIIVCPDIEAANVMYKTMNFLGSATSAAVIMGASVPVVLTSRADTDKSKLMSIALAAAMN